MISAEKYIEENIDEILNWVKVSVFNMIQIQRYEETIRCDLYLIDSESVSCLKLNTVIIHLINKQLEILDENILYQIFLNVPNNESFKYEGMYFYNTDKITIDYNKFKDEDDIDDDSESEDLTENDDEYPFWSGYLFSKQSYCEVYGYHNTNLFNWVVEGEKYKDKHPFGTEFPEILHVKETPKKLKRYPDLQEDDFIVPDYKYKRRFSIYNPVIRTWNQLPQLKFEYLVLTEDYPCRDITSGLFVLDVEKDSDLDNAGLIKGDIIKYMVREDLNYTYKTGKTKRKIYDIRTKLDWEIFVDRLSPNEKISFGVIREWKEIEVSIRVKFDRTKIEKFSILKTIGQPVEANYDIIEGDLYLWKHQWLRSKAPDDNPFNDIKVNVDDDMFLSITLPKAIQNSEFEIDNNGNLIFRYEK